MKSRNFLFNSLRSKRQKRNLFNLSYENKFTCNMGELYPFYVQDVLPHDTIKVNQEYLLKTHPLIAPIMHRVDVYQHYFFVPLRLIWDNFEKFITGGVDGTETAEHPYISSAMIASAVANNKQKLLDALGYPINVESGQTDEADRFSSLRLRAYNLVYNEFFRDQNLMVEIANSKDDGSDNSRINYEVQKRCWRKDMFTSALPFAQRGNPVGIPWSGGDIELDGDATSNQRLMHSGTPPLGGGALSASPAGPGGPGFINVGNSTTPYNLDPNGTLKIGEDFTISINDFRRASRLQEWLERNARAGARYVEQIAAHFGIHPSDYRLQRPQYLGGGRQPFMISEVVQTSSTIDESETTTPQGNEAGNAKAYNNQFVFKETFEEHGIIIGIMSVLPRTSYQQGVSRLLTKFDKLDYAWPEFGNLGEQEVKNMEVFYQQNDKANNLATFGYTPRYAEYKYSPDEVHGDFRSTLSFWHLGRIFENRPSLNASFVQADPSKRVFAVDTQDEDCLLFDVYNSVGALRCLPAYGTPIL